LPGGYPELHGGTLAGASRYLSGLRAFAETKPIHGVQFHPESIRSEHGHAMLKNFLDIVPVPA